LSGNATAQLLGGLQHESDADLLAAAVRQDAVAFGKLVERYHHIVFRVVWRMTNGNAESEDIAQEAFLKLWNNPGQLREAGALKGWLLRVAHNLVMDRHRKKPARDIDAMPEIEDGRPSADAEMQRNWAEARIGQAISRLPDRQRTALTLVHFEQLPQAQAAQVMDISVDALESLLARGRRSLKEDLNNERHILMDAVQDERH
jgi:RNA polymerase sigma-70 factor, ECF subfamily